MNCIDLFAQKSLEIKDQLAFVSPYGTAFSFSDLRERVMRVQSYLLDKNFKSGDSVLIAIDVSIDLYSTVIAVMGLGGTIILVEPWMPIKKISEVIKSVSPKFFVSSLVGNIWGLRVPEIRSIPHWIRPSSLLSGQKNELICEAVDEKTPGVITFTSGTSGTPKGVVREQGYLLRQFSVLKKSLHFDQYAGSDLCIFANWALLNLAQGRPTVFFPAKWSKKNFNWLEQASKTYNIETLTCGPAFIKNILQETKLHNIKDIHIGGALTPCKLFEDVFKTYPDVQVSQVYGSSEVEPVCTIDARPAVTKSKERNFYHTLYLGKPIEEISFENKSDGMWVTGPHVCPFYLNNQKENELNKRKDEQNRVWHFMGDRIQIDSDQDWWYSGRSQMSMDDFFMEQNLYNILGNDLAFIHRNSNNQIMLIGENLKSTQIILKQKFPQIDSFIDSKIIKDIRHRARIDRKAILAKLKLG
ncbi:MAG: AMP-binding protein [Bacteriovorax sp.]|nr:AMP-binding protein [Bacteriovorax sp.]